MPGFYRAFFLAYNSGVCYNESVVFYDTAFNMFSGVLRYPGVIYERKYHEYSLYR